MSAEIELIERDLERYVTTPSPSGQESELANIIFNQLGDFEPEKLEFVGNGVGAILDGESDNGALLFLACHIDTIDFGDVNYSLGTLTFRGENPVHYGPGAGDDKAGAALMTNIARTSAALKAGSKKLPCRTALFYKGLEEVNDTDVAKFADWVTDEYEPGNIGGIILEPAYNHADVGILYTGQLGGVTIPVEMWGAQGHPAMDYSYSGTALTKLSKYMGGLDETQNAWQKKYSDWTGFPTVVPLELTAGRNGQIATTASGLIRVSSTLALAKDWENAESDLHQFGVNLGPVEHHYLFPSLTSKKSTIFQAATQAMPSMQTGIYPLYTHQKALNDLGLAALVNGPGRLQRSTLHTTNDAVSRKALVEVNHNLMKIMEVFPKICKK